MSNYDIPTITSELWPTSESSPAPEVACLAISATSETGEEQLQQYQIEVRSQGNLVAEHIIAASNALKAITLIESEYGKPVQAEPAEIEDDNGRKSRATMAKNWHGYTFEARAISP